MLLWAKKGVEEKVVWLSAGEVKLFRIKDDDRLEGDCNGRE